MFGDKTTLSLQITCIYRWKALVCRKNPTETSESFLSSRHGAVLIFVGFTISSAEREYVALPRPTAVDEMSRER